MNVSLTVLKLLQSNLMCECVLITKLSYGQNKWALQTAHLSIYCSLTSLFVMYWHGNSHIIFEADHDKSRVF